MGTVMKSIQESIIGKRGSLGYVGGKGIPSTLFHNHNIIVLQEGQRKTLFRVLTDRDEIEMVYHNLRDVFDPTTTLLYRYEKGNFCINPENFDLKTGKFGNVDHVKVIGIYQCLNNDHFNDINVIRLQCDKDVMWHSIHSKEYKLIWEL